MKSREPPDSDRGTIVMTKKQACEFLAAHQPLPDDSGLSEELAVGLDEARKIFIVSPDAEAIPLFLNVFGDGSGFGVYQLVEDVLARFPPGEVIPHLRVALKSPHRGVRYWNAQLAAIFPSDELLEPLSVLVMTGDYDLRFAAITALEQIGSQPAIDAIRSALLNETDSDLRALMREVLDE